MKATAPALAAFLSLAACGGASNRVENTAGALENAAEQSDPAAAQVLQNAADEVREQNSTDAAQQALQEAGNAQAATVPQSQPQPQGQPAPPLGAKPHAPGDPVPPPKVRPQG